jgi:ribosomal protein L13
MIVRAGGGKRRFCGGGALNQVLVRCEEICLSGGFVRQKVKYLRFLTKRMNAMSSKGSIHFRVLARILWRTIQG